MPQCSPPRGGGGKKELWEGARGRVTRYLGVDVSHHEELDIFEHLLWDFQLLLVRRHGPGRQRRGPPPRPLPDIPRAHCGEAAGARVSRPLPPPSRRTARARRALRDTPSPAGTQGGWKGEGRAARTKRLPPPDQPPPLPQDSGRS